MAQRPAHRTKLRRMWYDPEWLDIPSEPLTMPATKCPIRGVQDFMRLLTRYRNDWWFRVNLIEELLRPECEPLRFAIMALEHSCFDLLTGQIPRRRYPFACNLSSGHTPASRET